MAKKKKVEEEKKIEEEPSEDVMGLDEPEGEEDEEYF